MGILCIDVGGSFLKHTVLDDELDIKKVSSAVTPRNDLNSFLREIRKIYDRYQGISGIAVSIPGIIDTERGFMYTGGSLDYIRDIPMAETISELCDGLPVSIENDAKAAATAELYAGVLKHAKNGIILTLGTAVGGTVIVETIFALPGIGRLMLTAVEQRDIILLQGIVLFITSMVVLVSLVTDLAVMAANPTIRTGEETVQG